MPYMGQTMDRNLSSILCWAKYFYALWSTHLGQA